MATRKKSAAKSVSKPGPKAAKPKAARSTTSRIPAPDVVKAPAVAAAPKVTAPPAASEAKPAAAKMPVFTGEEMKKKTLIDEVVMRSGVKKKDAKPVVEALLEVMGEAIAEGREMNLQPFGKIKYKRAKEDASNRVVIANIRQRKEPVSTAKIAQEAVAEATE